MIGEQYRLEQARTKARNIAGGMLARSHLVGA